MIRGFDQRTPILFVTGSRSFTERRARAIGAQGTVKKASPTFIEQIQARTSQLALDRQKRMKLVYASPHRRRVDNLF